MGMSDPAGGRSRSGWFVSIPLSWIVLGAFLAVVAVLAGIGVVFGAVVSHPGNTLQFLAALVVAGLALYGVCWALAHRGGSEVIDHTLED